MYGTYKADKSWKKIVTTKMFCEVVVWTNLAHITYILSLGLHSLKHISRGRLYSLHLFFFGQKWWTRFILHYGVLVSYKSKVKVFEVNFWIVCPWPNIDLAQYLPKYPNVCRQGVCHDLQLSSKIYKHIQVHIGFL